MPTNWKGPAMKHILPIILPSLLMPLALNAMETSSLDEGTTDFPTKISVVVSLKDENSSHERRYSFLRDNSTGHFTPAPGNHIHHLLPRKMFVRNGQAELYITHVDQNAATILYEITPTISWASYFLSWIFFKQEKIVQTITKTVTLPIGQEHIQYLGETPEDNAPDSNYVATLIIKACYRQ